MLLLEVALRKPDSAVELEATPKASLPDTLSLLDAKLVLDVGQSVPVGHRSHESIFVQAEHVLLLGWSAIMRPSSGVIVGNHALHCKKESFWALVCFLLLQILAVCSFHEPLLHPGMAYCILWAHTRCLLLTCCQIERASLVMAQSDTPMKLS